MAIEIKITVFRFEYGFTPTTNNDIKYEYGFTPLVMPQKHGLLDFQSNNYSYYATKPNKINHRYNPFLQGIRNAASIGKIYIFVQV